MKAKLSHKMDQRLALTPQLTQNLKVLAMNCLELEHYLEESIEGNPMLEMDQSSSEPAAAEAAEHSTEVAEREEWKEQGDNRWEAMYTPSSRDESYDREQQWHCEQSLSESLHEQIDRQPMSGSDRDLAHALIDSLDEDGYFRIDPAEFASDMAGQLETDADSVERVLVDVIQQLDPGGLGARDLIECLLLQLEAENDVDQLVRQLLLHFSDSFLDADETLARKADCTTEMIEQARMRMRRLDPFPGHGLHGDNNFYVRPEIIFRRNNDNGIDVEVPETGWRGVRLNERWQQHEWKGKDKEFMSQATKEAKWLLHALDQRSRTLMKVGLCLARRQRAFLDYGPLGLKPLTLQNVAEEVGLHESTISRVTNGKYADTPIGIIELRRFFSAGLPTRGGGSISVYRVKQRVKALIDSEPAGRPISDQAIADRLKAEGIEIARRTVAKYREQLGLLPSSQRRRAARTR